MDAQENGKIFVGGLSWDTTDQSLLEYFSQFGVVTDSMVMKKPDNGRSRGFGFVTFVDKSAIDIVLNGCPHFLDGRAIDPKLCNPRLQSQPKKPIGFKIFLGGLPSHATQTALRKAFQKFGNVLDVVIMYDQIKKKSRNFGFLTFENLISAEIAINSHYVEVEGRRVEIKRTTHRESCYNGMDHASSGISQTAEQLLMHLPINPCQILPDCIISAAAATQNLTKTSIFNKQLTNLPWHIPTENFDDKMLQMPMSSRTASKYETLTPAAPTDAQKGSSLGASITQITPSPTAHTANEPKNLESPSPKAPILLATTVETSNKTKMIMAANTNTKMSYISMRDMNVANARLTDVPVTDALMTDVPIAHRTVVPMTDMQMMEMSVPNVSIQNFPVSTVPVMQPMNALVPTTNYMIPETEETSLNDEQSVVSTDNYYVSSWNLQSVHLQPINLQSVNLQPVSLQSVNIQPINLQSVNLQHINLQPLNLQPLNLQPLNLQPVNLQPLNLQPLNLQPVNLQPVNLQQVTIQQTDLQPTNVQMSNTTPGNIQPVNYAQLKPMILPVPNMQIPNDFSYPMVNNIAPQQTLLTVPNQICQPDCLPSLVNPQNQWVCRNNGTAATVCPTLYNVEGDLAVILGQAIRHAVHQIVLDENGHLTSAQGVNNRYINNLTLNLNCDFDQTATNVNAPPVNCLVTFACS